MNRNTALALLASLALLAVTMLGPAAHAGNPHFVGAPVFTAAGATLTVSAKEAGLGDEAQIHVILSGDAQCVNPGGNEPQAANKETFSTAADLPVQNGKSNYTLSLAAEFQPPCSPPMSVVWSNVLLVDTTNGLVAP